jgi:hypothetical protein
MNKNNENILKHIRIDKVEGAKTIQQVVVGIVSVHELAIRIGQGSITLKLFEMLNVFQWFIRHENQKDSHARAISFT